MALNIPEHIRDAMVFLFRLEPSKRDQLLEELRSIQAGSPTSTYKSRLRELLPDTSPDRINEVVRFVFSVASLSDTGRSPNTVAKDLVATFRESGGEDVESAGKEEFDAFRGFITLIAKSQDSIGVRAKASRIRMEHERILVSPEIFSDMRSIFAKEDAEERPQSFVVTHSLKIASIRGDKREDLFFAMDYEDLKELKRVAERAIQKHETLASMLEGFGLSQVKFGGED